MAVTDLGSGTGAIKGNRMGMGFCEVFDIDFAVDNLGSGDSFTFWDIPAYTFIKGVAWKVVTAEGGTLTFDIGDYTNADPPVAVSVDGYADGENGNDTATISHSDGGSEAYAGGQFYPAQLKLGIIANNAADAAKIRVWVYGYRMPNPTTPSAHDAS